MLAQRQQPEFPQPMIENTGRVSALSARKEPRCPVFLTGEAGGSLAQRHVRF